MAIRTKSYNSLGNPPSPQVMPKVVPEADSPRRTDPPLAQAVPHLYGKSSIIYPPPPA